MKKKIFLLMLTPALNLLDLRSCGWGEDGADDIEVKVGKTMERSDETEVRAREMRDRKFSAQRR
jgi:hypothetical protein